MNELIYAVKGPDDIRVNSASGGFFTVLAENVIDNHGSVYGVCLDDSILPKYLRVSEKTELKKLNGSKYVQVSIGDTFRSVKSDLENGQTVLFSGTPCHVDGLKKFLGQDYSNLLLCDLVCHGCPSPSVYRDFVSVLPDNASFISFRDKAFGWSKQRWSVSCGNSMKVDNKEMLQYKKLFLSHYAHRPSCFKCPYTTPYRKSDITMGDFWGIERAMPSFKDELGVSLVILHSEKGKRVFDSVSEKIEYRVSSIADCLQPQLKQPVTAPVDRDSFWRLYYKHGYKMAMKRFIKIPMKSLILSCVPYSIRKTIRK